MLEYEKVSLAFLDTAPIKIELSRTLRISAEALFEMFEDPDAWGWATITKVEWESPKPYGVGTTRSVTIDGQGVVQEYFLAWTPSEHMAFRFEQGEMKAVSVLVEDYRVRSISATECELSWTIGMQLRGALKLLTPILGIVMRRQFGGMLAELGRRIDAKATDTA